jgi:hypothetical protein
MLNQTNARLDHIDAVKVPTDKERLYIDINTRAIELNNQIVIGDNNKFTAKVGEFLNPNKKYTVEVISFSYTNFVNADNRQPVILCDLSEPINVNGFTSSVLYKSQYITNDSLFKVSDISNNFNLKREVNKSIINSITFEIISSVDSTQFFSGAEANPTQNNVNIILLIQSK